MGVKGRLADRVAGVTTEDRGQGEMQQDDRRRDEREISVKCETNNYAV